MHLLLVAVAGFVTASRADDPLPPRPNVILIMTDDQGYGELGCHGNPMLKTPNLDRLASQSVCFTDFQVSPTCSPTRASLLTGRHEFRSGVTHTIHERERLALGAVTLPSLLQTAGYTTGIFGKWHLGDEDAYQPERRGFNEVFIHGAGGIGQSYPGSCGDVPGNRYFSPVILHNGTFEQTTDFCTNVFFDQATRWIDSERGKNHPFFALITPNAPHAPYLSPEEAAAPYRDQGLNEDSAAYYGMIANIDANVGKLLEKLREWKIDRNTLVIFMTDNGHPIKDLFNAGMRGTKGTPFQGGTRVPCFIHWPGVLMPGIDVDEMAAHVDILPTLAEICGFAVPAGLKLDGRSLVPLLRDPSADWADRYLFTHVGRWPKGKAADSKYASCAVRTGRFRFVNNRELFDLVLDPGETRNVIDEHPEMVAAMRAEYDQWWDEILPCLVNEDAVGPAENPFKERYWRQFGKPSQSQP